MRLYCNKCEWASDEKSCPFHSIETNVLSEKDFVLPILVRSVESQDPSTERVQSKEQGDVSINSKEINSSLIVEESPKERWRVLINNLLWKHTSIAEGWAGIKADNVHFHYELNDLVEKLLAQERAAAQKEGARGVMGEILEFMKGQDVYVYNPDLLEFISSLRKRYE